MNRKKIIFYLPILIIALTIIAIPVFLVPYYNSFKRLEVVLSNKEKQIEIEKEEVKKVEEAHQKLIDYSSEVNKIESAFPIKDLLIPEFYNFAKQEIPQSGVVLKDIGGGRSASSGGEVEAEIEKTIFSVSVTGSYLNFKNLLSNLYRSSRLVSIESISMSRPDESGLFQFNLSLGVYSKK